MQERVDGGLDGAAASCATGRSSTPFEVQIPRKIAGDLHLRRSGIYAGGGLVLRKDRGGVE